MSESYSTNLIEKLINEDGWWPEEFTDDFTSLIDRVSDEVAQDSVIGKIAAILIKHQALHQMTKDLIDLSHLYVQGELWPTEFKPSYDGGHDKMSGWYLNYYSSHCVDCKGKESYLRHAKRVNAIRNAVAHNLTGKNDSVINKSYIEFEDEFTKAVCAYNDMCIVDLMWRLRDLNQRVDFKDFL